MFDLIITSWFDDYIPVSCLLLIHPLEEVVRLNIKLDERVGFDHVSSPFH